MAGHVVSITNQIFILLDFFYQANDIFNVLMDCDAKRLNGKTATKLSAYILKV